MRDGFAAPCVPRTFLLSALLPGTLLLIPPAERITAQEVAKLTAQDTHEGLTISVQPWTDPALYKKSFAKKNPYSAGIAAIYVTFQNDSAETLRVSLERIRLLVTISEESRQDLIPLSSEDVADRTLSGGATDPTTQRPRIPLPVGKPKAGRSKEWSDLQKTARDAGVSSSIVPPHGKVQGLLYFDVAGQFDLLPSAHLYVPEVVSMEKNKALFYFDIDLAAKASR